MNFGVNTSLALVIVVFSSCRTKDNRFNWPEGIYQQQNLGNGLIGTEYREKNYGF